MVNDLKQLLRANVADAPVDHVDLTALVHAGRRRVRSRRTALAAGTAVLAAGAVVASLAVAGPGGSHGVDAASHPPAPDAPTLRLADAAPAVEGQDYRVLATLTNDDLNRGIRHEIEGVTTDGLILFRDNTGEQPRYALVDPATDEKDWLPKLDIGQTQTWPIGLGADELVLLGSDGGLQGDLTAYVFDRDTGRWSGMKWPTLPPIDSGRGALGPDGRVYVPVPVTGDGSFELWSVSLTDMDDVRDEGLRVGEYAFTDSSMVWTDATDGAAGMVHVRDLTTGEEHSFDPHAGDRCNLLTFGATDDRVVLSEYCGTYADGVRDDRVQILTTDGDQVATLQESDIVGWLPPGGDVVNVALIGGADDDRTGTYVYDLATDRFLRISDTISSWGLGGSTSNPGQFQWHTPVDDDHGSIQRVGELLK